jgi:hypothetical protein
MSMVVRISMAVLLSALCACGGTTDTGTEEVPTAQDTEEYCDLQCDRTERCNPDIPWPTCHSECVDINNKTRPHVRADYVRNLISCMSQLECETEVETCRREASDAIGATEEVADGAADVQACRAKSVACLGTEGNFDDELCGVLLLLVSRSRSQVARCFEGACDAIPACLEPVFGD